MNFMTPIPLYTSLTAKFDGLKHIENLSACSIQVSFQNGTSVEYDLRGQPLKPLEVERLVRILLLTSLNLPLKSLGRLLDVSFPPSSVTISAVRLHKSLSSEELEGPLSSVLVTSLTIDSDDASQDSGGKTILNED